VVAYVRAVDVPGLEGEPVLIMSQYWQRIVEFEVVATGHWSCLTTAVLDVARVASRSPQQMRRGRAGAPKEVESALVHGCASPLHGL
jgi:hypothetical protein